MIFSQDGQRGPEAILAVGSGSSTLALSYADWGLMFLLLGGQDPCARGLIGKCVGSWTSGATSTESFNVCWVEKAQSRSPQCPFLLVEAWDKWLPGCSEKIGRSNK